MIELASDVENISLGLDRMRSWISTSFAREISSLNLNFKLASGFIQI